MSTPKERPILFKGEMVRAILDGSKTQTRRVVKPQSAILTDELARGLGVQPPSQQNPAVISCPYGDPGDRLWVRETWAVQHEYDAAAPSEIGFRARWHYAATEDLGGLRKRPSIFLPRRGSRILLEITAVRVDRLQSISEADARAEGVTPNAFERMNDNWGGVLYRRLWEQINGPGSWDANPWAWVVEFRRLQP